MKLPQKSLLKTVQRKKFCAILELSNIYKLTEPPKNEYNTHDECTENNAKVRNLYTKILLFFLLLFLLSRRCCCSCCYLCSAHKYTQLCEWKVKQKKYNKRHTNKTLTYTLRATATTLAWERARDGRVYAYLAVCARSRCVYVVQYACMCMYIGWHKTM